MYRLNDTKEQKYVHFIFVFVFVLANVFTFMSNLFWRMFHT